MNILLILSVFALAFSMINLTIYLVTYRQRKLDERFQFALGRLVHKPATQESTKRKKGVKQWTRVISFPASALNRKYLDRFQLELVRAGIPLKAEEMIGVQGLVFLVSVGFALILFENVIAVLLMGILGLVFPLLVIKLKKAQRVKRFEGQLLDAVLLLANALRAGHSFLQGLEIISRDMPPPLSGEFNKVSRETKIGITLEEALMNLTKRVESKDLEMVVTGILIQRQIGGNMAEILDNIAHTIDKRIKNRAKIKALTAQTRASAWIVSLLPIVLGSYIFGAHPEFGGVMFKEPMGIILLVAGGVMMVLGILVIRMVIRIDI